MLVISHREAKSGMFFLKKEGSGAEAAYCHMGELCGEKGWTMILKADGQKVKISVWYLKGRLGKGRVELYSVATE